MLNEKRVRHMTKMAMFEKNEGPNYSGLLNFEKKDYLSYMDLMAFLGGTLFYAVASGLALVAIIGYFMTSIDITAGLLMVLGVVLGYVVFIYFYRRWMHTRSIARYDSASVQIKRLRRDYRILEDMYEKEEEEKAPSVSVDEVLL